VHWLILRGRLSHEESYRVGSCWRARDAVASSCSRTSSDHPAVVEAAAIGVPDELKGQALVCFCVLGSSVVPGTALVDELKALVAAKLGKPLRPERIEFVADLPKTRNAKVMRRVIRAAYLGQPLGDLSALENPQAVDEVRRLVTDDL